MTRPPLRPRRPRRGDRRPAARWRGAAAGAGHAAGPGPAAGPTRPGPPGQPQPATRGGDPGRAAVLAPVATVWTKRRASGPSTCTTGRRAAQACCTSPKAATQRRGSGTRRSTSAASSVVTARCSPTARCSGSLPTTRQGRAHRRVQVDVGAAARRRRPVQPVGQDVEPGVDAATGRQALEAQPVAVAGDDRVGVAEHPGEHPRRDVEAGAGHVGDRRAGRSPTVRVSRKPSKRCGCSSAPDDVRPPLVASTTSGRPGSRRPGRAGVAVDLLHLRGHVRSLGSRALAGSGTWKGGCRRTTRCAPSTARCCGGCWTSTAPRRGRGRLPAPVGARARHLGSGRAGAGAGGGRRPPGAGARHRAALVAPAGPRAPDRAVDVVVPGRGVPPGAGAGASRPGAARGRRHVHPRAGQRLGDRWNRDDRASELRPTRELVERAAVAGVRGRGRRRGEPRQRRQVQPPEGSWQRTFRGPRRRRDPAPRPGPDGVPRRPAAATSAPTGPAGSRRRTPPWPRPRTSRRATRTATGGCCARASPRASA